MFLRVVAQVAALAQRSEIVRRAILGVVIQVGHGQHDPAARLRVRLALRRPAKLAAPAGPQNSQRQPARSRIVKLMSRQLAG